MVTALLAAAWLALLSGSADFTPTAGNAPRVMDPQFREQLGAILRRSSWGVKSVGTTELSFAGDADSCRVPERARADPVYMGDADVFEWRGRPSRSETFARVCNVRSFLIRYSAKDRFIVVYNGPWPSDQPTKVQFVLPDAADVVVIGLKRNLSDDEFKSAATAIARHHSSH